LVKPKASDLGITLFEKEYKLDVKKAFFKKG